jgi:hypothetical protein
LAGRRKAAREAAARDAHAQPSQPSSTAPEPARLAGPPASDAAIVVWVSSELAPAVPPEGFAELTTQARAELFNDLGIEVPSIAHQVDATLE